MIYFTLILAIIFMVIGHYFKVYRLKQFIEIYEKPNTPRLLQALSISYVINFFVPFRLGDIFRAWWAGRKMKNGVSFSLTTVIVDRILDVIVVALIFFSFYLLGFKEKVIESSIYFYIIGGSVLLILLFLGMKFSKYIKISIMKFARIFNTNIELRILKFTWYIITAFKDLISKLKKSELLINTIVMWFFYLGSYSLFALTMRFSGSNTSLVDIFTLLFSKNSFDLSTGAFSISNYYMVIYLLVPLVILLILSLFKTKEKGKNYVKNKYLELLPQLNSSDKLVFLEGYFSARSREYFNNYVMLNRDISIIQDFSAGSNATTMLCTYDNKMFFRKYSFGKDSSKLYEQIKWLKEHQKVIPLTKVLNVKRGNEYCSYDMPYFNNAISCFNYVHSTPINKSWPVLEKALNTIGENLHTKNLVNADIKKIDEYIESKVINNLKKIENGNYIKPLLKYNYLIINGKKYHNLNYFMKYLTKEYLEELFKNDMYSDIHGDFTIENIICFNDKDDFYIIDPNTGNVHDSPNLDYAKLLQSLHGGYEFLMNTKSVSVSENNINYLFTKSAVYDELYNKYHKYLCDKFDRIKVKSIYFHEIIHWLRLLPYKIEKNGERQVLFYAGLIIVLNDVIEMFGDD